MQKGGTGKTTLALHLAIRAAFGYIPEVKKRVLLIDVDEQQNASKSLLRMETIEGEGYSLPPIHPDYNPDDPEDVEWGGRSNSVDLYYGNPVMPYPTQIHPRLDVLPSDGIVLKTFDGIKESADSTTLDAIYQFMHSFFKQPDVQELYDLVVFDCPPGKSLITTPILRAITDLILPTQAGTFSMDGVQRMIYEVDRENRYRETDLNLIGIIPNQIDERLNKHRANLQILRESPITREYMAPFNIKRLVAIGLEQLPMGPISDCTLEDTNAEAQIQTFIEFVRERMYGARDGQMRVGA